MKSIAARVILRYLAGYLVLKGLINASQVDFFNDPDVQLFVEMGIGLVLGGAAEGWLVLTRKLTNGR